MSLSKKLGEARMRDVRRHQKKVPSGAVLRKLFKTAMQSLGSLSSGLGAAGDDGAARQVDELAGRIRGLSNRVVESLEEAWKVPVYPHNWLSTGIERAVNSNFLDKELNRLEGVIGTTIMQSTGKDKAVLRWNVYAVREGKEDPTGLVGEYVIEMKIKKVSDKPKGRPPGGM